ncbi:MAG: ABC transporter permease, partial [Bacteroidota bacterium]
MLKNYFKIAVRNLSRNQFHSFILFFGLSLGITACLLLMEYVNFEWSYDRFHSKADRIYRVVNTRYQNGVLSQRGTITYPTIGPTMQKDFPEVEQYSRLTISHNTRINFEEQSQVMDRVLFVDEHFFDLFDFKIVAGDPQKAFSESNGLALSQSSAERLFGNQVHDLGSLLGTLVEVGSYSDPFVLHLIYEDFPDNSLLQAQALASYASTIRYWGAGADDSWEWSDF